MANYFDNYKFRCSALGKIMSPSGKITDANQTYLTEMFIGEMEGIRKEVTSRYFEKGKYMEEDGIDLLNKTLYRGKLLLKNKVKKENDYIHGEADCICPAGIVYDIKNAWDRFTFGKACLTYDYEWQGRGYMWLWGKERFRLFYCLNNMPEHLLSAEERKVFYANHFVSMEDPNYLALCEEVRKKHNYDHMGLHERFRLWEIEHSEEKIEKLKEKIALCRERLNEMYDDRKKELEYNLMLMGIEPKVALATYDYDLATTIVE